MAAQRKYPEEPRERGEDGVRGPGAGREGASRSERDCRIQETTGSGRGWTCRWRTRLISVDGRRHAGGLLAWPPPVWMLVPRGSGQLGGTAMTRTREDSPEFETHHLTCMVGPPSRASDAIMLT